MLSNALTNMRNKELVTWRNRKLTQVLMECLHNAHINMICTISLQPSAEAESRRTVLYGTQIAGFKYSVQPNVFRRIFVLTLDREKSNYESQFRLLPKLEENLSKQDSTNSRQQKQPLL